MQVLEKLLDYVVYETTSNESSLSIPSTKNQITFGKYLVKQLKKLGCEDAFIDNYGYVYGTLKANAKNYKTIGLIAHMDTAPDASGKDVKPRVIEKYDGKDIKLNNKVTTTIKRYPNLKKYKGKTIVVTDGNTLLGADDKAGIAIASEVLDQLKQNKNILHGDIKICFSPDEEIGRGADKFSYKYFKGVDYCYTIDGDAYNEIAYENFNAASARVHVTGISVHPGEAKGKMVNALNVAQEFHSLIDPNLRPENAELEKGGFNHLVYMNGKVEEADLAYIIRNFDLKKLEKQKNDFLKAQKIINKKYKYNVCELTLIDGYRNMKDSFKGKMDTVNIFFDACKKLNIKANKQMIRGGTDGATISNNGIPCPNLGTGGDNYHGPYEIWCKQDGEKVVDIILKIIELSKK